MRAHLGLIAAAVCMTCLSAAAQTATSTSPAAGGGEAVILDHTGSWRVYCRFAWDRISPEAMRREGEAVLDPAWLARTKKGTQDSLRQRRLDPEQWQQHLSYPVAPACVDFPDGRLWTAPPPPAEWAGADFDDSDWPRTRNARVGWCEDLRRKTLYFRGYFEPSEAQLAQGLSLRLRYRGGVRVLLNGQEAFRGHLPAGKLDDGQAGEDYPLAAYVMEKAECRPEWLDAGASSAPPKPVFCPEMSDEYESAPVRFPAKDGLPEYRKSSLSEQGVFCQATFDRVKPLRDRQSPTVPIHARLLRKGSNVLAVEVRVSPLHPVVLAKSKDGQPWDFVYRNAKWMHAAILALELRSTGVSPVRITPEGTLRGAVSPVGSTAGTAVGLTGKMPVLRVWVEDIHSRLFGPDVLPPGWPAGRIKLIGVPNGTHAAQLGVSAPAGGLSGLRVTVGELRANAGAGAIPAAAARISFLKPLPANMLGTMGAGRGYDSYSTDPYARTGQLEFLRFSQAQFGSLTIPQRQELARKECDRLTFFDQLSSGPVEQVPAGTCQAIWISWRVPAGTAPGRYRGQVSVEGRGLAAVSIPVEAEIIGWTCPGLGEFQTMAALEQSPYGVARQYQVRPWSDEHFRLMESSFRQLARLGNDWLNVPVINDSEFGNAKDSPIRWIRDKQGQLRFEYAALDRYLALAQKHWGKPRIINFTVMQGERHVPIPAAVEVFDEAQGKAVTQPLGPELADTEYRRLWKSFALTLHEHMKSLGLEQSMHWGFRWDTEGDPKLKTVLAEFLPQVKWVCAGHTGAMRQSYHTGQTKDFEYYVVSATIYYPRQRGRGWKNPQPHLATPRGVNTVMGLDGQSPPLGFRMLADRAWCWGRNGIGRMGADYGDVYYNPKWYPSPGFGVVNLLWPGPEGFEPSTRLEVLLEGVQEAEARVFIEQALESPRLTDEGLASRLKAVLEQHYDETTFLPASFAITPEAEYHWGWQARSARLFRAAAEAAGGMTKSETRMANE